MNYDKQHKNVVKTQLHKSRLRKKECSLQKNNLSPLCSTASCFMGDSRQRNAKYVRHVRQWLSSLLYALVLLKLPPLLAPIFESASRNKLKWQQSLLAGNYACLIDVETSASTSKGILICVLCRVHICIAALQYRMLT